MLPGWFDSSARPTQLAPRFALWFALMASPTAIPGTVADVPAQPVALVREAEVPTAAPRPPSIGTVAAQLGAAAARAVVEQVTTPTPKPDADSKPPPAGPRVLPAWLSIVLVLASNLGTAGAIVAGLGFDESKRIGSLEAENAAQREKIDQLVDDVEALTSRAATSDERAGKIEDVVSQQEFDRVEEVRFLIALSVTSLNWLDVPDEERPVMSPRLAERYDDIEVRNTRRKLFGKPKRPSDKVLE